MDPPGVVDGNPSSGDKRPLDGDRNGAEPALPKAPRRVQAIPVVASPLPATAVPSAPDAPPTPTAEGVGADDDSDEPLARIHILVRVH